MIHFLAPAFKTYPILVSSLICQTSPRWDARICHDGPSETFTRYIINDPRLEYSSTPNQTEVFGHVIRKTFLEEMACDGNDLVIITNHDNYCLPILVEQIEQLKEDFICWPILHNYYHYTQLGGRIEYGKVDVSQIAVRARIAKEVGWKSFLQDSDFLYVQECWKKAKSWNFLTTTMSIHN